MKIRSETFINFLISCQSTQSLLVNMKPLYLHFQAGDSWVILIKNEQSLSMIDN